MFYASKLLSFATQPLAWVVLLLTLGLLCLPRRRRLGTGLCWAALITLGVTGWQTLPDALLRRLEAQYPTPQMAAPGASLERYAGIIVLGGALEPSYLWEDHGQVALNDAAERMTVPVALLQRNPHLRLLFTGGEGALLGEGLTEAGRAKLFFDSLGVPAQQVLYESASRTTHENALLSAQLPGVDPAQPWLLLTSAWHMPRAMATFQKAGWNVTAYAVDYSTGIQTRWTDYSLYKGAKKWQMALHEMLGWWAYQVTGRL
jgi:uncharacterized SAM-binding protein YcdF (DUF218 family)